MSSGPAGDGSGPLAGRRRWVKVLHVALWTLLFYGLAVAAAKLAEWLSP